MGLVWIRLTHKLPPETVGGGKAYNDCWSAVRVLSLWFRQLGECKGAAGEVQSARSGLTQATLRDAGQVLVTLSGNVHSSIAIHHSILGSSLASRCAEGGTVRRAPYSVSTGFSSRNRICAAEGLLRNLKTCFEMLEKFNDERRYDI